MQENTLREKKCIWETTESTIVLCGNSISGRLSFVSDKLNYARKYRDKYDS